MIIRFGALSILGALCLTAHASTTHFYANAGLDSNAGTSSSAPRKTITQLNLDLQNPQPGDMFLLNRGDVFRDASIYCGSQYQNTGSQTLTSNPPNCAGANGNPIIIGAYGSGADPYVDAADVLTGTWTLVAGQTQVYHLAIPAGGQMPLKLYVDPSPSSFFGQMLLPVPNDTGAGVSTKTYSYLDMYEDTNGLLWEDFKPTPISGNSTTYTGNGNFWNLLPSSSAEARQSFTANGNTGLQNVEAGAAAFAPQLKGFGYPAYPGVWYVSGTTATGFDVYVNLSDGSSPNSHVIEATHRNYGALVEGTNNVTVQDIAFAHSFESCALDVPFSDSDAVGDNVTFQRNQLFNCANPSLDNQTAQNTKPVYDRAGILMRAASSSDPRNIMNPAVLNNTVGTIDVFFGTDTGRVAGIFMSGFDGGGSANNIVVGSNYVSTTNAPGITAAVDFTFTPASRANNGGSFCNNELTNNQVNLGFSNMAGGRACFNFIHQSYGEGIQAGGYSTSVDGGPSGPVAGSQQIDHNTIGDLGLDSNPNLFNGIDCNSSIGLSGVYITNNTIARVAGSGITQEGPNSTTGCNNNHVKSNVISMNGNYFGNISSSLSWTPSTVTAMSGNPLYFSIGMLTAGTDFDYNFYQLSSGATIAAQIKTGTSTFSNRACSAWIASNEPHTTCGTTDPLFVAPLSDNFALQASSPLRAAGVSGVDIGALAYTVTNWIMQGLKSFQGFVSR